MPNRCRTAPFYCWWTLPGLEPILGSPPELFAFQCGPNFDTGVHSEVNFFQQTAQKAGNIARLGGPLILIKVLAVKVLTVKTSQDCKEVILNLGCTLSLVTVRPMQAFQFL